MFDRRGKMGNWVEHKNPDGTVGGLVANGAKVSDGATVPRSALVLSGATVSSIDVIEEGQIVTPNGPFRFTP